MRYLAAFMIALCLCSAGRFVSAQLEMRIAKLEKVYILFSDIKSRIEFTADCVTDIFCAVDCAESYKILPFVEKCAKRLSDGESFDTVWKSSLSEKENVTGLKKEDVIILLSFGETLGTTDTAGQISNCEIHKKLIETKLESARDDYRMYSKPAKGIGVLAGVAVLILSI